MKFCTDVHDPQRMNLCLSIHPLVSHEHGYSLVDIVVLFTSEWKDHSFNVVLTLCKIILFLL